jgi:hypothetical protein
MQLEVLFKIGFQVGDVGLEGNVIQLSSPHER